MKKSRSSSPPRTRRLCRAGCRTDALLIRRYVDESPAFAHAEDTGTGHGPVAEVLRHHKARVLGAVLLRPAHRAGRVCHRDVVGFWPVATVDQVDALADAIGPRWRLMVYIAAYGPARPEEQAGLRRPDVDLETVGVWVRRAAPELTTGRRWVWLPDERRSGCIGCRRLPSMSVGGRATSAVGLPYFGSDHYPLTGDRVTFS